MMIANSYFYDPVYGEQLVHFNHFPKCLQDISFSPEDVCYLTVPNKYIQICNNIFSEQYKLRIDLNSANVTYLMFLKERYQRPIRTCYSYNDTDVVSFLFKTKDKEFFIDIRFFIRQNFFQVNTSLVVTDLTLPNPYDVIIDIDLLSKRDLLELLNCFKGEIPRELIDLICFSKMSGYEYIENQTQLSPIATFKHYEMICSYHGINIYPQFNFFCNESQQISSFIFTKNGREYWPESLKEFSLLCNLAQKEMFPFPYELSILYECYDYRKVKINKSQYYQIRNNDDWITIPEFVPNRYMDEYDEIKNNIEKRILLVKKLEGK